MFIDDPADVPLPGASLRDSIACHDLLRACAAEARRQAREMAEMDRAFGAMLMPDGDMSWDRGIQPVGGAIAAQLQKVDRLRQEIHGLAGILDLVAGLASLSAELPAEAVRGRVSVIALCDRLLSRGIRD